MNPGQIQTLLTRKTTADALPPETKQQFAEHYRLLVAKIVEYGLNHPLPTWDYDINSEILSITLKDIARIYEDKKPYVEWMCKSMVPEIDVSFREKDQGRFHKLIQAARQQIRNV